MIDDTHLDTHHSSDGRILPTTLIDGMLHAIDLERGEFIHLAGAYERERFDSARGRRMCQHTGVRTCVGCGYRTLEPDPVAWWNASCQQCGRPVRKERLWGLPDDVHCRRRWR